MILSFFLYLLVFGISSIACGKYERISYIGNNILVRTRRHISFQSVLCALFIILPPVLLYTFRGVDVGTDNLSYLEIYDYNKNLNLIQYLKVYGRPHHTYEIGYQQILWLSFKIRGGYNLVKYISGLVIVFFSWRGSLYYQRKFKINSGLCMFLFYLLEFSFSLNVVRFCMALSVFFFAFQYVIEKDLKRYLIYCCIAFLLHSSMIVTLALYLVNVVNYKKKKKVIKKIYILSIIIGTVFLRVLIGAVMPYLSSTFTKLDGYEIDTSAEFGLGIYVFLVLFLIPLIRWDSFVKKDVTWICVLMVALLYIPLRFLSYFNVWLNRLMRIAEMMLCIIYCGFSTLSISRNEKALWNMYIVSLAFGYYVYSCVILGSNEVYPYYFDFTNHL